MKTRLAALVFATLSFAAPAYADGCNPDFGDKYLKWVRNDAGRQSRELAAADFQARNLNYRLVGYERLHRTIEDLDKDLDAIAAAIKALDESPRTDVALAVEREQVSERFLTQLYTLEARLEAAGQNIDLMRTPTSRAAFGREGYAAVGRETLIASTREIGAMSSASLGGRYSVYIQVTFDEDGNPQSGDFNAGSAQGMTWTVGVALMKTGNPYAAAAGVIVIIGGIAYDQHCKDNWEKQVDKVKEGDRLLPSKLITDDEQWAAFQTAEKGALTLFEEEGKGAAAAIDTLETRWKTLFTANSSRAAAAESVLTVAKIAQIKRDLAAGLDTAQILRRVAIADAGSGVDRINAAIARGRIAVLTSCADTAGYASEEVQRDSILFARAQFKAFSDQAAFAPLHDLLKESDRITQAAGRELARRGPSATRRSCDPNTPVPDPIGFLSTLGGVGFPDPQLPMLTQALREPMAASDLNTVYELKLRAPLAPAPEAQMSFCVLLRSGGAYSCGASGSGTPYGAGFNDTGDPRNDVQVGANDGGAARDSRRMSDQIDAASNNIELRIRETRSRTEEVQRAVPGWLTNNLAALDTARNQSSAENDADRAHEEIFRVESAPLLAQVAQQLRDFTASPMDAASVARLVAATGGADMRLPSLPRTAMPPSLPQIVGINALEATFGADASPLQREVQRESWKAEAELPAASPAAVMSRRLVDQALKLDGEDAAGTSRLARELLRDASSLRYVAAGALAHPTAAVVRPDGSIGRQDYDLGQGLPPDSLFNAVREYQYDADYYHAGATQLRDSLASGASFAGRRAAVLDVADGLYARAEGSFREGDVPEAQAWMKMALGALDIATRFIPGIDWGRDVYEAVSGRDLFTGETLSTVDRVSAFIGVISAGIGNDGLQIVRAFEKFPGFPADKWDEIYEFAQTVDDSNLASLTFDPHAIERIGERFITHEEIVGALKNHSPLWSREHGTYLALGDDIIEGGRIGVAINIERGVIPTVMWMPANPAEILSWRLPDNTPRYTRINLD